MAPYLYFVALEVVYFLFPLVITVMIIFYLCDEIELQTEEMMWQEPYFVFYLCIFALRVIDGCMLIQPLILHYRRYRNLKEEYLTMPDEM